MWKSPNHSEGAHPHCLYTLTADKISGLYMMGTWQQECLQWQRQPLCKLIPCIYTIRNCGFVHFSPCVLRCPSVKHGSSCHWSKAEKTFLALAFTEGILYGFERLFHHHLPEFPVPFAGNALFQWSVLMSTCSAHWHSCAFNSVKLYFGSSWSCKAQNAGL